MLRILAGSGAGVGGAYAYHNHEQLFGRHFFTSPGGDKSQFDALDGLRKEIYDLRRSQHQGYQTLIVANQPSTIGGVPVWKILALSVTLGGIYWKVKGYELKDLVYVSKKHFTTVTDALKEQFEVVKSSLTTVKEELMNRVHILETKLVDAREAIEAKLGFELGKVDSKIDTISTELVKVNEQLAQSGTQISEIAANMTDVKNDIAGINTGINTRLSQVHSEVEELRASSDESYSKLSAKTTNIESKIERLSLQTNSHLSALQTGLDESAKGIKLLCEFVANSQPQSQSPSNPQLFENIQAYVSNPLSPTPLSKIPMMSPIHFRAQSSPSIQKFSLN